MLTLLRYINEWRFEIVVGNRYTHYFAYMAISYSLTSIIYERVGIGGFRFSFEFMFIIVFEVDWYV